MKSATLGDVLRRSADQRGDWVAISFNGERRMTFGELDLAANRMASSLADIGLDRGDRVAIFLANRPEYFTALFALARAGLVSVPMNRRLAPAEAARVVADAGARYLITEPAHSAVAEAVRARGRRPRRDHGGGRPELTPPGGPTLLGPRGSGVARRSACRRRRP